MTMPRPGHFLRPRAAKASAVAQRGSNKVSLFFLPFKSRLQKRGKKRVRAQGARLKLGVELRAEEKWMHRLGKFRNFHKFAVGRRAGEKEVFAGKFFYKIGIHFVAVAVALLYELLAVRFPRDGALFQKG